MLRVRRVYSRSSPPTVVQSGRGAGETMRIGQNWRAGVGSQAGVDRHKGARLLEKRDRQWVYPFFR